MSYILKELPESLDDIQALINEIRDDCIDGKYFVKIYVSYIYKEQFILFTSYMIDPEKDVDIPLEDRIQKLVDKEKKNVFPLLRLAPQIEKIKERESF